MTWNEFVKTFPECVDLSLNAARHPQFCHQLHVFCFVLLDSFSESNLLSKLLSKTRSSQSQNRPTCVTAMLAPFGTSSISCMTPNTSVSTTKLNSSPENAGICFQACLQSGTTESLTRWEQLPPTTNFDKMKKLVTCLLNTGSEF